MRANTGGHAVVLPCPQCARTWSTEQTMAGHLMDTHGMDASPAVAWAMQVAHEMMDKRHSKVGRQANRGGTHEPQAAEEERAVAEPQRLGGRAGGAPGRVCGADPGYRRARVAGGAGAVSRIQEMS